MNAIVAKTIKSVYWFSHNQTKRKFFKVFNQQKQKQLTVYPHQYPQHPLTDKSPLISRGRPIHRLTPKYQIPNQMIMQQDEIINNNKYNGKWTSPQNAYTLNVGLIGPVNAGKSQLFGALAHQISAVSPKAATTSEIISAFKSYEYESDEGIRNVQIQYFDTPGLMYRKEGFVSKGWAVLSKVDFSLLVVDSAKRFDDILKQSIKRLEKHRDYSRFMKSLVLNKIDLVDNRRKFDSLISQIQKYGKIDKIFYVSAKTGYGIKQLNDYLIKMAKPGQWQHPPQVTTTMTELQILQQMMRESMYRRSYKQVPHQAMIQCKSYSKLTNGIDQILFDLLIQSQNQQRMIIGKKGKNIQQIINWFKLLYAKMYQRQAIPIVSVKIQNQFKKKYGGSQMTIVMDDQKQNSQQLRILNECLSTKRFTGIQRNIQIENSSIEDKKTSSND